MMTPRGDLLLHPCLQVRRTVAVVLAGGQGERLYPLTRDRAKPAVPFGGIYRIIDFTLSNCVNSGIRRVHVLTQYKSYSLERHIKQAWSILSTEMGEYVDVIPPQQRSVQRWYEGTADALFQNIYTLQMERPELVLILGGDHVYKMDYSEMIAAHLRSGADVTVACTEVPLADATRMGVLSVDAQGRVGRFDEKPAHPEAMGGNPDAALVSMGIYVFPTATLIREVTGATGNAGNLDFGRDILPDMVRRGCTVMAFPFRDRNSGAVKYWRDIGTLDSYFEAHMDLVAVSPIFNLYDTEWPIRTYQHQRPPAKTVFRDADRKGEVLDSLVSSGCIISGARVEQSVLGPGVFVHSWAHLEACVAFENVEVGRHAQIRRAIIDKDVRIPAGERIGFDLDRDRQRFTVTDHGVVVIPKGHVIGSDVDVCSVARPPHAPGSATPQLASEP
jgi:glucose-1-phosphate adenylyltransferase